MPILLEDSNCLILLTPKTGSRWLAEAIRTLGLNYQIVGNPKFRGHDTLWMFGQNFTVTAAFVRNPISWYGSYWAYQESRGWPVNHFVDTLGNSDLRYFVEAVLRKYPKFLTRMFEEYTGKYENPIAFIGKQEFLRFDLLKLLDRIGEPNVSRIDLLRYPAVNKGILRYKVPLDLQDFILEQERDAFERYGYVREPILELAL